MKKEMVISAVLAALTTLLSIVLIPYAVFDDAYIHFRIAQHFGSYFLPYFNLSEPVMATSSFVWTLFLAPLTKLPFPLLITIAILNSIFLSLGSLIWSRLLAILSHQKMPFLALFLFQILYMGVLLPSTAGLMETSLALLLLGISIFLLIKRNPMGWILMGIAIFTRYEISVFAFIFMALWILDGKNEGKFYGIVLFTVTIVFFSLITIYWYSTILSNPIGAKQIVYQLSIASVFNDIFFSLFPLFQVNYLKFMIFLAALIIIVKKLILTSKTSINNETVWGMGILLGGFLVAIAYTIKHIFLHEWYIPLFSIPIIFGFYLLALSGGFLERLMLLVLSLAPVSMLAVYIYSAFVSPSLLPTVCSGARVHRYIQIGKELNQLFPAANLLSSEIGGLGYSFHHEIIDAVGLVTPGALKYHPMKVPEQRSNGGIGAIPAQLVMETLPELIVSYPIFVEEFDRSAYTEKYTKISIPAFSRFDMERTGCSDIWEGDQIYIYIRNGIATDEIIASLKKSLDG